MDNKVIIERSFDTSLSTLWNYWTDPSLFATWFGPGEAVAEVHSYETVAGSSYEVAVVEPNGVTHLTTGVFKSVKFEEELIFTWKIHDLDMEESLVTINFKGNGTTSELRLVHERLTKDHAQMHEFGWMAALSNLNNRVSNS